MQSSFVFANDLLYLRATATSHPEWCGSWFVPAWFVDSAVRWRRNGAGGLKEFVLCGCLPPVFCGDCFLQLAVLREPQPVLGFNSGTRNILVPKPVGRVLRASAGRGFGSHG